MDPTDNDVTFPQARLDEMRSAAREFRNDALPATEWRFDQQSGHFDSAESAFTARQLEYMRPGLFEVKYPALTAESAMPWNTSIDPGAEQYTITIIDQVGVVRVSKDLAGAIPRVEVKTSQKSLGFFSLTLSYAYTVQDARAAMMARMPLIPTKAMATRGQMARKLDDIAFLGDTDSGLLGLLSQTGLEDYTVPATGAAGSKTWESKDPDAVLLDLNAPASQIVTSSKGILVPNAMLLPNSSREYINGRRIGDGTSSSILAYFLGNNSHIRQVDATYKSETAGSGNTKRGLVYTKDPTCLEFLVSQPFEQFAPQAILAEVVTVCHMRTGGLAMYQPKSAGYMDGI